MNKEVIIFADDPSAAKLVTGIEGWVDRTGMFWGKDESTARRMGATHKKCDKCDGTYKVRSYCEPCSITEQNEKFKNMPEQEYTTGMLCSMSSDTWFQDLDEAIEHSYDQQISLKDMMLVIGVPNIAGPVYPEDEYGDILFEDQDVPDNVQQLFDELNEKLKGLNETLSWELGNNKLLITPEMIEESVEA